MSGPDGATGTGAEVIALVTSAGGLEALTAVLRALPEDLPAAVVVAQHLGTRGSLLVEILDRRVALPVVWAEQGGPLVAGRVTVCPPRARLEVLPDRTYAVTPRADRDGRSLDALLLSVAESVGAAAVGVVLTGMGSDGTRGAAALRAAGGLVIAQSAETAEQAGMPQAAAAAGAVDLVLPVYDIGPALVDAALGRRLPPAPPEAQAIRSVFGTEGVMAATAAALGWSRTPLGRVTGWSPVLRTMIRLVMGCPEPAVVLWGTEQLAFYNDGAIPYVRPHAPVFPPADGALRGDPTRHPAVAFRRAGDGRVRDVWADVTDTPIRDPDGTVVGVHRQFLERTAQVLAARRMATLNALRRIPRAGRRRDALTGAFEVLGATADLPFALGYLLDAEGVRADLIAATGVEEGGPMAPRDPKVVPDGGWPLHEVATTGRPVPVDDVAARFRGTAVSPRRLVPRSAVVHPLRDDVDERVVGMLVLGADPYLRLDDDYRDFLASVAAVVEARLAQAHAARRERERLARLAELDRARNEFFSNVSHEFRTPLTLMLGPLDAVLERATALPADLAAELAVARRNARRLLRLTGSLLDFARIEADSMREHPVPTDLAARTREIVAHFDVAAARAGLRLRTAIEPIDTPFWIDVEMWEKILANLLSNALKFTFSGAIEVALRPRSRHVELVVSDSGIGIAEEELPYIFKRFHRVRDAPARTREGAGIGLALVAELVRRQHGRIRTTSVVGAGTTFTVWIPRGRTPADGEDDGTAPAPAGGAVAAALAEEAERWDHGPHEAESDTDAWDTAGHRAMRQYVPGARILVVEENRDMRDYLERLLGRYWRIRLARDGPHALDLARADPPDLILSDVLMPGLDGFALLAALRADERLAGIPIVLLTARADEEAAVTALLAGADDYIVKPFPARELIARVGGRLELTRMRHRHCATDAFRVALTDTLRAIDDPVEVQARAAELIGRHLGAARAYYQEFDRVAGTFTVHRDYTDGLPSLAGTYPLADYDDDAVQTFLRTGRPLVVRDAADLNPKAAASWAALSVRTGVAAPNLRAGVCVAALGITGTAPRDWTDEEIALIDETAQRTWAFVERARAEADLRASEERFRTVADTVPALIWHNDAHGENVFVNRAFRAYTGLTDAQIGGERWQALVHPDEAPAYVAGYLRAVRERTVWRDRNRLRCHDGSWQTFDNYASPLLDVDGTYLGHVGVSVNVERAAGPEGPAAAS